MKETTLARLALEYDAFLVDQFGVLLSGDGAYPYAPAALSRLAKNGKPVLLLSNSGKRADPNIARLLRLGFARDSFLTVLSSGEAAHAELAHRIGASLPRGARVLVLSRDGDLSGIEGLDLVVTGDAGAADLILLAGSEGDTRSLGSYRDQLADAAARGVPCLCSNPDMTMLTTAGTTFGAGRITDLYAELGGPVERLGKPFPLIYRVAARMLPDVAPHRVLCIGDSPEHDIAGGRAAGHATALVRSGIHAYVPPSDLIEHCKKIGALPDFILPAFQF
jgi:HAD superfamily hydrolase (TIGR01459 family)